MSKFLKIFGIATGIVILLLVLSGFFIVNFFNPNRLKPIISQKFYEQTGLQIVFKGDIQWTLFPVLGFNLNDIQINNPKEFSVQPFASINKAIVSVKLLPLLLHKDIQSNNLTADGLTVNLIKNKSGAVNWKFRPDKKTAAAKADSKIKSQSKPIKKKSAAKFTFQIKQININNSAINWQNMQSSQQIKIKNFNLRAKNIQNKTAFPIKTSFDLDSKKPDIRGSIKLSSQLLLKQNQYYFTNLVLNTKLRGENLPNGKLDMQLNSDLTASPNSMQTKSLKAIVNNNIQAVAAIQLKNNIMQISPITAKLYQGTFNGSSQINFSQKPTHFSFKGNFENINIYPFLQDFFAFNNLLGKGNLTIDINTKGMDKQSILKNLNGRAQASIKNGAIKNIDLTHYYKTALALINKQSPPKRKGPNQTDFGNLTGTAVIKKGVIFNDNLLLLSSSFKATGKGIINLITRQLDYQFSINSIGAGKLDEFTAPIIVSGALNKPAIKIDMKKILQKEVFKHKEEIQKKLDRALELFKVKF